MCHDALKCATKICSLATKIKNPSRSHGGRISHWWHDGHPPLPPHWIARSTMIPAEPHFQLSHTSLRPQWSQLNHARHHCCTPLGATQHGRWQGGWLGLCGLATGQMGHGSLALLRHRTAKRPQSWPLTMAHALPHPRATCPHWCHIVTQWLLQVSILCHTTHLFWSDRWQSASMQMNMIGIGAPTIPPIDSFWFGHMGGGQFATPFGFALGD